ncbi:ubiquinol-cytochrome c reductase iron-sulfur subunit [Mucilaginibacter sp. AK015]|uniref:QcrA and Rieske domain-containing protein n=1 Tax=Mucilaginibacter sp. AK015 TaxID=2723072 RepID=UPI00161263A5|nr:Rieske (2Fe-2S) protein [Mucilaginibacter sp. AK015]MBB5395794.1 Rieske Fe-S protein [Mucilaginibacter sp. AK015]
MSTRRSFIKSGCAACILIGAGMSFLESCSTPLPMIKLAGTTGGQIAVGTDAFANKGNMLVVRSKQLEYDILLIKNDDAYKALYLRCTHEGVGLTPAANKIFCSAHGSVFDLEGKVVKEPALRPLKTYPTEVINNQIIIHLS